MLLPFRVAAVSLLAASAANAAIFDSDDRVVVPRERDSPYAPIGVVGTGILGRYATGFLVDECHALTVQHIFGRTRGKGRRVLFTGGFSTNARKTVGGTVILDGGYERYGEAGPPELRQRARAVDWMLIRLDQCLGSLFGSVRLQESSVIPQPLASAGFPRNGAFRGGLKLDPSCAIRGGNTEVLLNDCAARKGNSGSPLFRETTRRGRVVLDVYAMQSAALDAGDRVHLFDAGWANVATPMSQILPRIRPHLRLGGQEAATVTVRASNQLSGLTPVPSPILDHSKSDTD